MGVYNHFDSKFGIIEALFIQGFERLREALTSIADIEDPYEALREGGRRYRDLALAHPMVYQVMFLRAVPGFEPSDHALEVAGPGIRQPCRRRPARHGRRRHCRRPARPRRRRLIWASIHGWVSLELLGIGFVEDQQAGFDRVCTTMLAGLSPAVQHSRSLRRRRRTGQLNSSGDRAGPGSSAGQLTGYHRVVLVDSAAGSSRSG